jgi:hypothetical protein
MKYLLLSVLFVTGCQISISDENMDIVARKMIKAKATGECVDLKGIKPKEIEGIYCIKYLGESK